MKAFFVGWNSPSNIALVKYWGKLPGQIPANPSVSFTLNNSITFFEIAAYEQNLDKIEVELYFEGTRPEKFENKIVKFLESQIVHFPWVKDYKLVMHSKNTFPHSSGIASSASSMSALCLCLLSIDEKIKNTKLSREDFYKKASFFSRLASGSAARSVYPGLVTWGEIVSISESSSEYAKEIVSSNVHPIFKDYCDAIMIVDANEKSVSSRAGHSLMENHPFKEARFKRARENTEALLVALKTGDLEAFVSIVEEEALSLHACMMTSSPSFILLKPRSLEVIEKIRQFREQTKIPVCFTIDAGPNIHLLYPMMYQEDVKDWINHTFSDLRIIYDHVGNGPINLKE